MSLRFQPISLHEQERYHSHLARCPQKASDYSFANIFGWAEEYCLEWCFDEELVWIRQRLPEAAWWAPVGPWADVAWEDRWHILRQALFQRVPVELTKIWRGCFGQRLVASEARGQWDYVYSVRELVELKGNRFHKKKNLLNQFLRSHQWLYHPLDMDCVERVLEMQQNWCTWKECAHSPALDAENTAVSRVLQNWDRITGLMGGTLEVDGEIVAYTVAEALTENTVVIHFEKGHTGFKGVYQAMNNMFLERGAKGFAYVNREQDLDDEGLRKAKLSYNPVRFLEKDNVRFLGTAE